jgi:hypothetical protein
MNNWILYCSTVDFCRTIRMEWEDIEGELSPQEVYEALFQFHDVETSKCGAEALLDRKEFSVNDKSNTHYTLECM